MSDIPKIVIAEDNKLVRTLYTHQLNTGGFKVVGEGENGEEAITLTNALNPDILLLDVNMPVMNGIDALQALVARGHKLCVIMLSAEGQSDVIDDCLLKGAYHYIRKDKEPEKLAENVAKSWSEYKKKHPG